MSTKVSEFLIEAKKLIEDESTWTKEFFAKTKTGSFIDSNSDQAVCFCSIGALLRVRGRRKSCGAALPGLQGMAEFELNVVMGGNVAVYNDDHDHATVMAALDKAINSCIERGI